MTTKPLRFFFLFLLFLSITAPVQGVFAAVPQVAAGGGLHSSMYYDGFSYTIKSDGTLWAWGFNGSGQLGNGSNIDSNSPVQIGFDNDWAMISAGGEHTLALKSDGALWAWGANWYGQLGDSSYTERTAPVRIGMDNNWSMISAGYAHSIALKTDGTLWAWGLNNNGQLGDSTYTQRNSPVQIGSVNTWSYISAGAYHSAALRTNNTLWAWGANDKGQLGNNSTTQRNSPVQIGTITSWSYVAAGPFHTLALRLNGTQWAWGLNKNGQLGNCTMTNSLTPVSVSWVACPDITAPTGTVVINANAAETNTVSATLTITCNDAESGCSEMCISNTTNCIIWESLSETKQWALADSDGTRTVYVKFKDNAGNASGNFTDTITLRRTDLTVSSLAAPASASPGATISVTETTKNISTLAAPESRTNIYFSSDANLDAGDVLLGGRNVPSLVGGASSGPVSTLVTLPAELTGGTYYIIVKSDSNDAIEERFEANNVRTRAIAIGPDFVVSAFRVPASAAAGANISVTDTTKNNGTAHADASVTRFYFSTNRVLDGGDTLLGGRDVPSLAAGASSGPVSTLVTLPAEITGGTYYIIAKADGADSVAEANEANNLRTAIIRIGPDLVVSALSAPDVAATNTTIGISNTIRNNGAGQAAPSVVRFYLSANSVLDGGDTLLGSRNVPSLSGSQTSSATTSVTIPSVLAERYYFIIAKADDNNEIVEFNESNNTRNRRIYISLP